MTEWNWTLEALRRVQANGLSPAQVDAAMRVPPRLRRESDGMIIFLTEDADGTLIEVWMVESPVDDELEMFTAFEAGLLGSIFWKNAIGEGQ